MTGQGEPHVGAIFIAYNAATTLEQFWKDFPRDRVRTAILVDDASRDGTFELAQRLGIQSYRNAVNLGYGGNMKRALSIARELGMDIIIDLHPDGEYDPAAVPLALERMKAGADFVLGNRFRTTTAPLQSGMYVWKLLPIVVLNAVARFVLAVPLQDLHQGFRVYSRRLVTELDYEQCSNGYLFSFELIAQAVLAGKRIDQVPVQTRYTGKKRGASLKDSMVYSLGVFRVLALFLLARAGLRTRLFRGLRAPKADA
ncbi:MAG: glycosyltransferase family 2 protein [Deltaproteobacteria bacterium]|nr:glycosyltransferase family 2 protein [Deltaproteobacteria bacterium]